MRENSIAEGGRKARGKDNLNVRNGDRRNFVMVPNSIIRGGHKPQFLAVLFAIASHAGDGECYASAPTIGEEVGVKRDQVFKAIKYWEEVGCIEVTRERGKSTSIVTVFDFAAETRPGNGTGTRPRSGTPPVPEMGQVPVPEVGHKEEPMKKNLEEDNPREGKNIEPTSEENKQVAEVMEVFIKSINPELTYGHKGERSASLRLIRSIGIQQTLAAARFAITILPDRYAPTCTKPSELERNLARLRAHRAKMMNQESNVAFVS